MTTHGSTVFIIGDEIRVSEAAADGFLDPYSQTLLYSMRIFVAQHGEQALTDAMANSIQLTMNMNTYEFNDVKALERLRVTPKKVLNDELRAWAPTIWEVFDIYARPDFEVNPEARTELASALLSNNYSHNFLVQFEAGVFFIFYDDLANVKPIIEQHNNVVNFNDRTVTIWDYDNIVDPFVFTFDEIFSTTPILSDLYHEQFAASEGLQR